MVTSLATVVRLSIWAGQRSLCVATVLAVIVMYDARGVRQESGKQARVINEIVQTLFTGHPITDEELKELVGHTTIQVVVGGLIGIIYSLVYLFFRDWF